MNRHQRNVLHYAEQDRALAHYRDLIGQGVPSDVAAYRAGGSSAPLLLVYRARSRPSTSF
jgi:hypothetical protein